MKLREIAELLGAELFGDGDLDIFAVAAIDAAKPDQITFLANEKYTKFLESTAAGAVIIRKKPERDNLNLLLHPDPYYAFARCLRLFYPMPQSQLPPGVASTAVVDPGATVADSVHIGDFARIGQGTSIAETSKVMANVVIGSDCKLGRNCLIYPNVTIYDGTTLGNNVTIHAGAVIGSDGYGYAPHQGEHFKVLQIGRVRIEDDVEIGANTTIDRAALGETVIGQGTKVDNLVQLAHNVEVGKGSLIVAQAGVSGSTKLGKYVILAGQAGLIGHINIGDGAVIAAQAGVMHDLEPGTTHGGSPSRDFKQWKRIEASLSRLPDRIKELRELRRNVERLSAEVESLKKSK